MVRRSWPWDARPGVPVLTWALLLTRIPVNDPDNVLHLILGLVGLGAGAATPTAGAKQRPTAKPA